MQKILFKKQKGIAIPMVFMVLMIVLIIGMAAATISSRNLGFVNRDYRNTRAFYAAESGIVRAVSRLRTDNEWDGTSIGEDGRKTLTFENVKLDSEEVTYTVWVYNNFKGYSTITGYKGIQVPPGYTYLVGVGTMGSSPFTRSVKHVGAMVKRTGPFDDMGIFSDKSTYFAGSINISAYDSSTGTSEPGEANVGTNGNDASSVVIEGSAASIDGSVYAGPGSYVGSGGAIYIEGQPNITGDQRILPREVPFPKVKIPESIETKTIADPSALLINLEPGKYNDSITVTNKQNIVLSGPGTYVLSGVVFSGKGTLSVDTTNGPVKIIMDGDIAVAGDTLLGGIANVNNNETPKPTDLAIYGTDNCKNVAIGGNATAYSGLYARSAEVVIHGNPEYYGAIIADKVSVPGNPTFHYDTALSGLIDDVPVIKVTSWHRY